MKKITKWLSVLLAGLLLVFAVTSCGALDALDHLDDALKIDADLNGGNDDEDEIDSVEGDPAYRNLTPAEFVEALNTATDLKITVTTKSGSSSQLTKTLIRDGNIACDGFGDQIGAYYDMENFVMYVLNGNHWNSSTTEVLCQWDSILKHCTNFAPYCFVAENYDLSETDDGVYPVKEAAIREYHGEGASSVVEYSSVLKVKGSTYTVESTYKMSGVAMTYIIVVQFADQELSLPNMEE